MSSGRVALADKSLFPLSSIVPRNAVAVTPSDSTTFRQESTLFIGGVGGGALKVTTAGDQDITYAGVTTGFFPVAVVKVWSTGTDVTNIVRHY